MIYLRLRLIEILTQIFDTFEVRAASMHSVDIEDLTPEHRLLIAIVERSYRDLFIEPGGTGVSHEEKLDSKRFFLCKSLEQFSYRWICQHLDVDPQELLDRLHKLESSESGHLKDRVA